MCGCDSVGVSFLVSYNHLLAPGGFLKTREQGADRYKKKGGRAGVDMGGM